MKKLKKAVPIFLASLLAFSVLTGCKGCKQETPPIVEEEEEDIFEHASTRQGIDYANPIANVSEYSVALSSLPTETEKYAAEQLVNYVKQITGKTLPYATDGNYVNQKIISIGRTRFLETSGIAADKATLGNDGFVMKTKDSALLICGGGDRGTLYGVYDFLEYCLDVKWLSSTDTYVPQNVEAKVYQADRTEVPAFDYRVYLDTPSFMNDNATFATTSRFTSEYLSIPDSMGGNIKWSQTYMTHNSLQWANVSAYVENGQIKEEYRHAFSHQETASGLESVTAPNIGGIWNYAADLCYTDGINADGSYEREYVAADGTITKTAIAMVIDNMKEFILNDKDENNFYMFGQSDLYSRPCLCADCLAAAQKYGDGGMFIRFANALSGAIAEFVEEEKIQREVNIIIFAYLFTKDAPVIKNDDGSYSLIDATCKPNENIVVRLAPIGMNNFTAYDHESQENNDYGSDYMQKWQSICNRFMLWDYVTNFSNWYIYYPTMPCWSAKLKQSRDMGVESVLLQSTYREAPVYQAIMERWVASKMLWNLNYDVNELVSEFHKYYFGDILAPYADAVINMFTAAAYEKLEANNWNQAYGRTYATKGLLKSILSTIEEGRTAVNNSNISVEQKQIYLQRLQLLEFHPRYMYLFNYLEYENDEIQMNIEAKQLISEIMERGGTKFGEGDALVFDLENIIFK